MSYGVLIRRWLWPAAFVSILALAAVLRFHDLPTRGTWDADQGHDMLVLHAFVVDGVAPLLGPPTSIGDFHHGALYYYLLAPAALLGGGDPAVVVGEIALLGIAAVGLVAALARQVAGIAAGIAAGVLMAVSASAVDESTFLWNPNLVAFSSALAVWAAWRAWSTGRARWWLAAAAGQAITMQCHVLGWTLLAPLAVWLLLDLRRRTGSERRRVIAAGIGGLLLIALTYLPLVASELQTGYHETRSAIAFLAGGGQATAPDPLLRVVFVSLRIIAWPLTGLLTDALAPGVLAAIAAVALLVWRVRVALPPERDLVRWIAATIAWSWLVLGLGVSSLASVTPLPVDHYHAFLDPLVVLAVAFGAAGLWRLATGSRTAMGAWQRSALGLSGPVAAVALIAGLFAWNVAHQPPPIARDGGYPAALAAAQRVAGTVGSRHGLILSVPAFKAPDAYLFPLSRTGAAIEGRVLDPMGLQALVVVCDDLFVDDCGGPAEDAAAGGSFGADGPSLRLADRFSPAPGRTLSIYLSATQSTAGP
jgi:4-amino-4-deoxy-L-arabinose transferase-like glycosyltransferase